MVLGGDFMQKRVWALRERRKIIRYKKQEYSKTTTNLHTTFSQIFMFYATQVDLYIVCMLEELRHLL